MTLFTSDDRTTRTNHLDTARNYLFVSIFLMVFGAVYEHFSFGVYSNYMLYAFAAPLLLGVLPFLLLGLSRRQADHESGSGEAHAAAGTNLWHTGVAVLATGSLFRGVLDIYGTASPLTKYYWIAGGILLGSALLCRIRRRSAAEGTGHPEQERQIS